MDPTRPARQFDLTLEIAAPRDAVWRAVSDASELTRWFAPRASIDARVGGEVSWVWGDEHAWPQTVEVCEPGARLKTRYDSGVEDDAGQARPLFVDFQLSGTGGTTTLRLVHSGFGPESDFDSEFDGISRGWPAELRGLKLYLEAHRGCARQLAWCTRHIAIDPDAAWERLMGPEGFDAGSELEELSEGAPFAFTSVDGDRFEGRALRCDTRELTGVVTNHGDGFLRLGVESCGGTWQVWTWLATWGEGSAVDGLEQRWRARLEQLFPEPVEAVH